MDKIKHVVLLMLENRSLDNVLGHLYGDDDPPKINIPETAPGERRFDGLRGVHLASLANQLSHKGDTYMVVSPSAPADALGVPYVDPQEEYEHVNMQLFENEQNPTPGQEPSMKGFLQDFAGRWSVWKGNEDAIGEVMQTYSADQLGVLNGLARHYAVSDRWFSSVPTQTNANRAFAACGTSMGRVNNMSGWGDDRFKTDTIWNVLSNNEMHDWKIYWQDVFPPPFPLSLAGSKVCYTRRVFPKLEDVHDPDSHFEKIEDFHVAAENGELPAFSFLEPKWTMRWNIGWGGGARVGFEGSDYHPPGDLRHGEEFVKSIYASLTKNKEAWEQTLLIVTFDEHGGTYDHVPPPWGATPPWGKGNKPEFPLEKDFGFDRFGVRVPTILISPLIDESTVFRSTKEVPYDHTSTIATVLQWALPGVKRDAWGLGKRVENAPTFDRVVTRSQPRSDDWDGSLPVPKLGEALHYGDRFSLQHSSGLCVTSYAESTNQYYATVGGEKKVSLTFVGGSRVVQSGETLQIQSYEEFPAPYQKYNLLGRSFGRSDYYYSYVGGHYQDFRVDRVAGPGGLRYGDEVKLTDLGYKVLVSRSGKYLGAGNDTWTVMP